MTLTEQIAAVLAEHGAVWSGDNAHTCQCGAEWRGGTKVARLADHAAHQAAHLAPLVRQAEAEAWDEAVQATADAVWSEPGRPRWGWAPPRNPYRADRIEAEA